MKRFSYVFSVIVASALFFAPVSQATQGDARVRVIHASPDAPAVDVLVNNVVVIEDLSFGNVTPYTSLAGGTYSVKVRPANSSGPDVISTQLQVKGSRDYTVAAVNKVAEIQAEVFQDNNRLNRDNKAKLRVVHLSPGAGAVDIALKNGAVLVQNLSYRNESDYLRLAPGTYSLEVRVAGTNQVVLDIPNVSVTGGNVYQVYAVGLVGSDPAFGVRVSVDQVIPMFNKMLRKNEDRFATLKNRNWHWNN